MKLSSFTKYLHLRVINTEVPLKVLSLAVTILLSSGPVKAQDAGSRPSGNVAQTAWIRGDYETAYNQYSALLLLYSRDPLYQYYTGACLVKMERDSERSVQLLSSALNSSVHVKSVPDDIWFYYGRALQMSGSFSQAREAYERFVKQAGRKVAAVYEVQRYIDQCIAGTGAVRTAGTALPENRVAAAAVTVNEDPVREEPLRNKPVRTESVNAEYRRGEPVRTESVTAEYQRGEPARTEPSGTETTGMNNEGQVSARRDPARSGSEDPIKHDQTPGVRGNATDVPDEQFRVLDEALVLRHEADSLELLTERASRDAGNATGEKGERMERNTADASAKAAAKAKEADSVLLSSAVTGIKPDEVLPGDIPSKVIVSRFEVKPGLSYSESNPVPVDKQLPDGLVYSVQIAAFRNDVSPSLFRGLFPVFGRKRQGSDAVYYYTGLFRRLDDARKALPEARGAGFPDAFIIAFADGAQVSMERASMLEAEWSSKPLTGKGIASGKAAYPGSAAVSAASATSGSSGASATKTDPGSSGASATKTDPGSSVAQSETPVPVGTLSFRAEVMRIEKPVRPDVIQKIEQLAGTRGLEMIKNNSGETVFLIGNFITFESADDYVSLLIRNGYSSARVAAYVGTQEIPVEAARELLNRLPDD